MRWWVVIVGVAALIGGGLVFESRKAEKKEAAEMVTLVRDATVRVVRLVGWTQAPSGGAVPERVKAAEADIRAVDTSAFALRNRQDMKSSVRQEHVVAYLDASKATLVAAADVVVAQYAVAGARQIAQAEVDALKEFLARVHSDNPIPRPSDVGAAIADGALTGAGMKMDAANAEFAKAASRLAAFPRLPGSGIPDDAYVSMTVGQ